MVFYLFYCQALGVVDCEYLGEEVLQHLVALYEAWVFAYFESLFKRETIRDCLKFLLRSLLGFVLELKRVIIGQHKEKQDTSSPDINLKTIPILREELRRQKRLASDNIEHAFLSLTKLTQSEVIKVNIVLTQFDELGTDIAVD